jgi:hypothetical protein
MKRWSPKSPIPRDQNDKPIVPDAFEQAHREGRIPDEVLEAWANQTPDEWWKDLLGEMDVVDSDELMKALRDLGRIGCDRDTIVGDLMDLAAFSSGHQSIHRSRLPGLKKRLEKLADELWLVEVSHFVHEMPNTITSADLSRLAAALDTAYTATSKSQRPKRDEVLKRLSRCVNRATPRGSVGKVRANEALALLISAASREFRSVAAQRVATYRANRGKGTDGKRSAGRRATEGSAVWLNVPRRPRSQAEREILKEVWDERMTITKRRR